MGYVFMFDHRHDVEPRQLNDLLGGKGANLAEMTSVLQLPVPPGFTISTEACRQHMVAGWPDGLTEEVDAGVAAIAEATGATFGDPDHPLLVSVRSGAKFSMPGMMDTVLNLGLNDVTVEGLARATNDRRFALDSYRRFIQMFAKIVHGADGDPFEEVLSTARSVAGVANDGELDATALDAVVEQFNEIYRTATGTGFPQDPAEQLHAAIAAVFGSWNSPRARAYRRREHIDDDLGTAVNVQLMVYGNRDDRSGTGVGFTRNPATGAPGSYGDFLVNAQGEDVVAGIRQTLPLAKMGELFPGPYQELLEIFDRLEDHYRDMLDTEFTVEQGKLWMLQTRIGKRTGEAALRIAVAMHNDPKLALTPAEAVRRVSPQHLDSVLHPQFAPTEDPVLVTGLAASPGAAVGRVYFTANDAVEAVDRGEHVILVRDETSPEDVSGLEAAEGVLTSRGGLVSHAAVVARGWGKPAVVGAQDVEISVASFSVGDITVYEGDTISINGTTGEVLLGAHELAEGNEPPEFHQVLGWADDIRGTRLGVRANADNGPDARRARRLGAEGIGLARTEHMFLGDRLPIVRRVILAESDEHATGPLQELLEIQRQDFVELLDAMDGRPITIRLLDPPLHEFLPDLDQLMVDDALGNLDEEARELYRAASSWHEVNPMLGTRGVRLGIVKGGLYKMQVRAVAEAAVAHAAAGGTVQIGIMVPLVVTKAEMALVRGWIENELADVLGSGNPSVQITIGSMVETPRAALRADDLAEVADFLSFGTNDLTQMTFGFSRDDVEGRMMSRYLDEGLLPRNPFETIDHRGVGELVATAVQRARAVDHDISIGVCGEHGGDPESITFFHSCGVDYVSCSPFRVPIARLAAAHAVLDAGS